MNVNNNALASLSACQVNPAPPLNLAGLHGVQVLTAQQQRIAALEVEVMGLRLENTELRDFSAHLRHWAQLAANGRASNRDIINELKFDLHWDDRLTEALLKALTECVGSESKAQLILYAAVRRDILQSRRYPNQGVSPNVSHSIAYIFKKRNADQTPEDRFAELEQVHAATNADWTKRGCELVSDFITTIVLNI